MDKTDWVRSMRIKQGLKAYQLAELLQVSAARVCVLEKDEKRGAVTLKMMDKAARAMGCRFEYRIRPLSDKTRPDNGYTEAEAATNALTSSTTPALASADKPRFRVVLR